MYSERARRYMAAMDARYGPDYLHDVYQTYQPVWSIAGEEEPMPFCWWVEERAAEWDASQRPAAPMHYAAEDLYRMRLAEARAELARLEASGYDDPQTRYRMWVLAETIRRVEAREEVGA